MGFSQILCWDRRYVIINIYSRCVFNNRQLVCYLEHIPFPCGSTLFPSLWVAYSNFEGTSIWCAHMDQTSSNVPVILLFSSRHLFFFLLYVCLLVCSPLFLIHALPPIFVFFLDSIGLPLGSY